MQRTNNTIYSGQNIRVRHDFNKSADTVVICFANLDPAQRLDSPVFGEPWVNKSSFSGIYFNCSGNEWYQYAEMQDAVAAAVGVMKGYRTVISYGTSMGAYAAIAWSGRLGAHRTLAIAPQFSITPARAPFEPRWLKEASTIEFIDDDICREAGGEIWVAYDPSGLDGRHAAEIAARLRIHPVPLRHCGHMAPLTLSQMGLLAPFLRAVADGSIDVAAFQTRFRGARALSASYLSNLSQSGKHLQRKARILRKALMLNPDDGPALIQLGDFEMKAGAPLSALEAYQKALIKRPRDAWLHSRLGRAFAAAGNPEEALNAAEAATKFAPQNPWFWFGLGEAAAAFGDRAQATEAFAMAVRLEPQNAEFRKRMSEFAPERDCEATND